MCTGWVWFTVSLVCSLRKPYKTQFFPSFSRFPLFGALALRVSAFQFNVTFSRKFWAGLHLCTRGRTHLDSRIIQQPRELTRSRPVPCIFWSPAPESRHEAEVTFLRSSKSRPSRFPISGEGPQNRKGPIHGHRRTGSGLAGPAGPTESDGLLEVVTLEARVVWMCGDLCTGSCSVLSQQDWDPRGLRNRLLSGSGLPGVQHFPPHNRRAVIWTLPQTQVPTRTLPAAFLSGCYGRSSLSSRCHQWAQSSFSQ